jgi:RNA polymerase sigma factor (sigma-70 family)
MKKYSEQELIDGLRNENRQIILFLMKQYAENVKKMVYDLKIDRYIQSEDVIQDSMVELIINIRENKFKGTSSVSTYYYSICRFICLKLYNKFKNFYFITDNVEIKDQDITDLYYDERLDIVLKILKNMKKECIEIIDLRFGLQHNEEIVERVTDKRGFEEIAKILQIEYANARQRFSRCIQAVLAEYRKLQERNLISVENGQV